MSAVHLKPRTLLTADQLSAAAVSIGKRLGSLNVSDGHAAVSDGEIVVTVPAARAGELRPAFLVSGQLSFRQVLSVGSSDRPKPRASAAPTEPADAVGASELEPAEQAFRSVTCAPGIAGAPSDTRKPRYLVSCSTDGTTRFLLDAASIDNTNLKDIQAGIPAASLGEEWQINLAFDSRGAVAWANLTTVSKKAPDITSGCGPPSGCNAVAIVIDGTVVAFPRINEPILSGDAQITGGFTELDARLIAAEIRYPLPTPFMVS
jgi:preprotein translocase subunit SecD